MLADLASYSNNLLVRDGRDSPFTNEAGVHQASLGFARRREAWVIGKDCQGGCLKGLVLVPGEMTP